MFLITALVAAILIIWLTLRVAAALFPLALSIFRSIVVAVTQNPEVRTIRARHPAITTFVTRHLDPKRFDGLTATVLSALLIYVFMVWLGTIFDFLASDPIVQADIRLANLIHAYWSPIFLDLARYATAIGDIRTVILLFAGSMILLFVWRRADLQFGLSAALLGEAASVALLKHLFHRPRPDLAYFVANGGSFPSGHAAVSIAFFGMLFYIGWRMRLLGALVSAALALSLSFAICLSRLYLLEHYLTDVLNGVLVGCMWLLLGIATAEWWQARQRSGSDGTLGQNIPLQRPISLLTVGLIVIGFAWSIATYSPPRNLAGIAPSASVAPDVSALLSSGTVPMTTEAISGRLLEPINIVVIARDDTAFENAMGRAGWRRAELLGIGSLLRAAWAAWTNQGDPVAPVTPYFWAEAPNDYGYQRPTSENTLRKRHHARFWRTNYVTADGRHIYIGAASFDDGLDWGLLHHINPNIDAERDTLTEDMRAAGVVVGAETISLSQPHMGETVAGDPWFSDGSISIVEVHGGS